MKRTAFAVLSLVVLFSTAVISQLCNSANANPGWRPWENWENLSPPPYSQLEIIIESPVQGRTYSENTVWLNFTVIKPSDWAEFEGQLASVIYYVDSINIHSSINQNFSETEIVVKDPLGVVNSQLEFSFSFKLAGLSDGMHSLIVIARGALKYQGDEMPMYSYPEAIYFVVDATAPVISGLSIENKTYIQNDLSLDCRVDQSTSWKGYSLDGMANVTFKAGSYFSNLASGSHSLTVYANDTAGNMGASETIYFTIAEPFPTSLVLASAVTVAAVLVGLSLLLYGIRRKQ